MHSYDIIAFTNWMDWSWQCRRTDVSWHCRKNQTWVIPT